MVVSKSAESQVTGTSGIGVDEACGQAWVNMQNKHLHRFIIFKIQDSKIIVDYAEQLPADGNKSDHVQPFLNYLATKCADTPRYIVIEIPDSKKIAYMFWSPENANVREKMLYASSEQGMLKPSNHDFIPFH